MENPSLIVWKKEYETSIVLVDKQHRNLVDIINNLNDAYNKQNEVETLRNTIFQLVEYTKVHFDFEEKHMIQNAYTKIEKHKAEHKSFIDRVVIILEQLKNGKIENLTEDILSFLTNWLIDHILKEDRDYARYYKMRRKYV